MRAVRLARGRAFATTAAQVAPVDTFARRHIGLDEYDERDMLEAVGFRSLADFMAEAVPSSIGFLGEARAWAGVSGGGLSESEARAALAQVAALNEPQVRSLLGQGYHGTLVPPVVKRNMFENAGWYTAYTPYQAEISQGRMEMLLNYQTLVCDLTGMHIANASMLDEGTAAAEALSMCHALHPTAPERYFVDRHVHPQTLAVVRTRAAVLGLEVCVGDPRRFDFEAQPVSGALLQYPQSNGVVPDDMAAVIGRVKLAGGLVVVAADLLSLCLLQSPGALGADVAVGTAQRFGVPMGYGGPHAAFLACKDVKTARRMPGRIISVSVDRERRQPALRMALQTREQHIRRDKATSNICTAQALLANMAAAYAIYHGPRGLRDIAERVHSLAHVFHQGIVAGGGVPLSDVFFDTVAFRMPDRTAPQMVKLALEAGYNIRAVSRGIVSVSFDETCLLSDVRALLDALTGSRGSMPSSDPPLSPTGAWSSLRRDTPYMTDAVFNEHHSETSMLRYLYRLQNRDLSLVHAMIPLGSCTMKLNAAAEMEPISWPGFANIHPFAPASQTKGYRKLIHDMEQMLASITGFDAVSLAPNSGAQGEYAGLRAIKAYHDSIGQGHRKVCLIPSSAHGTNPASAVMAGLKVVVIKCEPNGYVDLHHLAEMIEKHGADNISCAMITYPTTYGVFEENVRVIIDLIHQCGTAQVYMDGANMNAQVGLTSPGFLGADVCHLNLHKTFCIPHGGGGPGVGPIGVRQHLAPFLPMNPLADIQGHQVGPVTSAAYGNASILPVSWMYIKMMGTEGLARASKMAILSANYMRVKLKPYYRINYVSASTGLVAHEFIVDLSPYNKVGIHAEDVAKRLVDYGFHAPTMNWPVAESLMIEPTESESKAELDRFIEAMIQIREEIRAVQEGKIAAAESPLQRAPHTLQDLMDDNWNRPYTRNEAVYPLPWVKDHKFWPAVNRIDNVWGDRNLFCSCDGFAAVSNLKQ